ncbi:MAG TPA: FtsX-like permease family protein [Ktedonobacterales bacterium]|nr:FtsX-like permease family protein [Ktedonobacterales bacterium]
MKMRMYWNYATRSLARGGQRTVLAISCVAVGVLAIVSLQLVTNAVTASFTGNIRQLNGGDVAVTADTPLTPADLTSFDTLQRQGTITDYTAAYSVRAQVRADAAVLRVGVYAVDPERFPLPGGVTFTSPIGGNLATVLQGDTVVITSRQAQAFDLKVGDSFRFSAADGRATEVTVGGIIASTGFFQGPQTLVAYDAYAALPSALGQAVGYNEVYADVAGHTDANAAAAERLIRQQFPLSSTQTAKELLASQQSDVQTVQYFLQIVGLLALLIGGVGIVNTIQVALRRRRLEIAMLKTAGYRRGDLFALFGLETGLLGLLGGIIGALAGVGMSFLVGTVLGNALQVSLPVTIDARTVGAGVAVGFVTALIFGLLPIVQASSVRPVAVLRELSERTRISTRLASLGLSALVAALFFALALGIVQSPLVALAAVGGTGVVLALLGVVLGVVVLVISKLPVPESFRWWYALLVGAGLLVGGVLTLRAPAFGVLLLAVSIWGVVVMLLPRPAKANVKMALRDLGRRKARSVATLIALTVGIFAIGLVLVLGQDIHGVLATYLNSSNINIAVVAGGADRSAVEQQLAQVPGLTNESVNTIAQVQPVSINGQPVSSVIAAATATGRYNANDVLSRMDGVQGYDLARGQTPNASLFKIVQGTGDARLGRDLTASDAGSGMALLPLDDSRAPLNLRLGDTITLADPATHAQSTITVAGFYNYTLAFEPIQVDGGVVTALTHGSPSYLYMAFVDPNTADRALAHIQAAVPGTQTFSVADMFAQITSYLNNLVIVLVTVASLAMLAAIIIIANAVALAMLERRREIGILKAVGYTNRSVLGEVLIENGVIGFTGGALAMLLAAVATQVLGTFLFNSEFATPASTVLVIVPLATLACVLIAALVAWPATRVRPLEVLRYE